MADAGGVIPPRPSPGMWMTSHGQCPRGGGVHVQDWGCFSIFLRADDVTRTMSKGGVLVNVQEWGCFSFFRRADDVTRTMSKGGCACECLHPPPFKNPGSAPVYRVKTVYNTFNLAINKIITVLCLRSHFSIVKMNTTYCTSASTMLKVNFRSLTSV